MSPSSTRPSATVSADDPDLHEIGHYVVTAHPPGSVLSSVRCSFISDDSVDVVAAKSSRLEVRRFRGGGASSVGGVDGEDASAADDPLPLVLTLPVNGRILGLAPVRFPSSRRDCLFFVTEKGGYALISYDERLAGGGDSSRGGGGATDSPNPVGEHYPVRTHASGSFRNHSDHVAAGGRESECGPMLAVDPLFRCIALHMYDGYVIVIPINAGYDLGRYERVPWRRSATEPGKPVSEGAAAGGIGKPRALNRVANAPLGDPYKLRIEERTLLGITFLRTSSSSRKCPYAPQLAILHQDARGFQHVVSHGIDFSKRRLIQNAGGGASASSGNPRGGRGGDPGRKMAAGMPPPGEQLRLNTVEGGSGCLIPVPPPAPRGGGGAKMKEGEDSGGGVSSSRALGGVVILGQRHITYHSTAEGVTRVRPTGGALLLSHCRVIEDGGEGGGGDDDVLRYLLGDERGRIHLLTLMRRNGLVAEMYLDVLGTASASSSLVYLGRGYVFVGSQFGDSQLVRILDEPAPLGTIGGERPRGGVPAGILKGGLLEDTTYVSIAEEYANLGPIVDLDLRPCDDDGDDEVNTDGNEDGEEGAFPPMAHGRHRQSVVATCSGVAKDGTVRLVRNGVGMREHAAVDMGGIKGMWSLKGTFHDVDDAYLVQGFVRETRILGVTSAKDAEMDDGDGDDGGGGGMEEEEEEEEEGGALAEVTIPGFDSSRSTLFACNVLTDDGSDLLLQVVDDAVRLADAATLELVARWSPLSAQDDDDDDDDGGAPTGFITVASANGSGQIVVALRGGALVHLVVEGGAGGGGPAIRRVKRVTLEREISCVDLSPFGSPPPSSPRGDSMDVDAPQGRMARCAAPRRSDLVAVGLWDDFSVRLLSLRPHDALDQILRIDLGRPRGGGDSGGAPSPHPSSDDGADVDEGGQHMMARSLCLVTMEPHLAGGGSGHSAAKNGLSAESGRGGADMLLVGLGDGKLISFVVERPAASLDDGGGGWSVRSRKEVGLGTQGVHLVPFRHGESPSPHSSGVSESARGSMCVLATGDRPTVVYLAGGNTCGGSPRLNYSAISLAVEEDDEDYEEEDDSEEAGARRHRASHRSISVKVASPFRSSLLFSSSSSDGSSSLCVADDATLRLGVIDDVQKLHITSFRLGMTPRRIAHHAAGRAYCVGCIGAGTEIGAEANQDNCVRFFDDSTFDEIGRVALEPFEMILAVESVLLGVYPPPRDDGGEASGSGSIGFEEALRAPPPMEYRPYVVLGTAYGYPDEDEPSQGRVLVIECNSGCATGRPKTDPDDDCPSQRVSQVADLPLNGGIYAIAPFYDGSILISCGSKTLLCQLSASVLEPGEVLLNRIGSGHHGHIISLFLKSRVSDDISLQRRPTKRRLAIVGDLMRSISLVEYYPKYQAIEELARDYNANFCTAITMLTNNVYIGCEGYNNLFVLRYNPTAKTEQARVRLDTVGQYHLGEMVNAMMGGSLIMPGGPGRGVGADGKPAAAEGPHGGNGSAVEVAVGSRTLYGTVDGTVGCVLGLGGKTFAFLAALQRAMDAVVRPVGDMSRAAHRAWECEGKRHGACGFADGDWIETFLDLDARTMERVVAEMNADTRWRIRDEGRGFGVGSGAGGEGGGRGLMDTGDGAGGGGTGGVHMASGPRALTVEDVLGTVEEISMLH